MALEIDQEIIATTKCEKGFACLTGEEEYLFPATESLGYNMVMIDGPTPINCPYSVNYGELHGCKCQARVAIYKKYKR